MGYQGNPWYRNTGIPGSFWGISNMGDSGILVNIIAGYGVAAVEELNFKQPSCGYMANKGLIVI